MASPQGMIFDIIRGTTHDGPGVRTTLFLKGCSLRCRWCQNPESIRPRQEIWWDKARCIGCMACLDACAKGALTWKTGRPCISKSSCSLCMQCIQTCPAKALTVIGQEWTLERTAAEILKDKEYMVALGGGLTVSGGEPLEQPDFLNALFQRMRREGIHTALDTSGMADWKSLEKVLPHTDCVLYDLKHIDPATHAQLTGKSNDVILGNLMCIADYIRHEGKTNGRNMTLWIRTPLVPGATVAVCNLAGIGTFIHKHLGDVVQRWELCAFNKACVNKYHKLGTSWFYEKEELLTQKELHDIRQGLAASGISPERYVVTGLVSEKGSA